MTASVRRCGRRPSRSSTQRSARALTASERPRGPRRSPVNAPMTRPGPGYQRRHSPLWQRMSTDLVATKGPLTTPVAGGLRSLNVQLRRHLDLSSIPPTSTTAPPPRSEATASRSSTPPTPPILNGSPDHPPHRGSPAAPGSTSTRSATKPDQTDRQHPLDTFRPSCPSRPRPVRRSRCGSRRVRLPALSPRRPTPGRWPWPRRVWSAAGARPFRSFPWTRTAAESNSAGSVDAAAPAVAGGQSPSSMC